MFYKKDKKKRREKRKRDRKPNGINIEIFDGKQLAEKCWLKLKNERK